MEDEMNTTFHYEFGNKKKVTLIRFNLMFISFIILFHNLDFIKKFKL